MKEFKNIPSKLYEKTDDWIAKEKNLTKTKYSNFQESKPKPRRIMSASASRSHRNLQPGINQMPNPDFINYKITNRNKGTSSMFDNYYHDKMVEKKLIPSAEEEKAEQQKLDLDYQFESHLRELRACNNIESQLNEQYETIKKAQLKANTPGINEKGLILEKNNKNYLEENKKKISNGEIKKKTGVNTFNKSYENPYHKEYGKTPQYLKNMKIEAQKKKKVIVKD